MIECLIYDIHVTLGTVIFILGSPLFLLWAFLENIGRVYFDKKRSQFWYIYMEIYKAILE